MVEDASLKSLFLSLLAFQPAVRPAVSSVLFAARPRAPTPRSGPERAGRPLGIVNDIVWSAPANVVADEHDLAGHHRYYGRSAYPD